MAYSHYDRLTALDAGFLGLETPESHMHVGSVGIFEPGPLARSDGSIDFDRIHEIVLAGLRRAPRFRQKLARVPLVDHPVWVDDPTFNVLYHVRHSALPAPGDTRQLKRLMGRIMSQKLDSGKPMWEMWVVEGLEEGHFAIISKVHHCLIDGISGVDLLGSFMGRDPQVRLQVPKGHWIPRPAPGPVKLLADDLLRRASLPMRIAGGLAEAARHPLESASAAAETGRAVLGTIGAAITPASETPFNVPLGPHRRFDWTHMDLGVVREIKDKLGGKLNDVVLACVAGAVRSFLRQRRVKVSDLDFRVFIPVSTRAPSEHGKLGNRVSLIVASLPVSEGNRLRRYEAVVQETRKAKESGQVAGTDAIERLSDWTTPSLLTEFSRLAAARRAYNLVVTNVPGPPGKVYLDGALLRESYPLVPLFTNQALGIALLSYGGGLFWGFNADWDAMPDLHSFVRAIDEEFDALRKL